MIDLKNNSYSASDIQVLEGLEPVRLRPGMYIGGTDEKAWHHLPIEILDNSVDEAVAGFADHIIVNLIDAKTVEITDNGRGIPVDPHPKYPDKSALEVILTTLHSGGKFNNNVYKTSGGLHGVGSSVVNALSELLDVEVAKDGFVWIQHFSRGKSLGSIQKGEPTKKHGTKIKFTIDSQIFGDNAVFKPVKLYRMARAKSFLSKGVKIEWICNPDLITEDMNIPVSATFFFPDGLAGFLTGVLAKKTTVVPKIFSGVVDFPSDVGGRVEWAMSWLCDENGGAVDDGFINSYCNTIATIDGGTHETGLRSVLVRGLKNYAERVGNKKYAQIIAEDVLDSTAVLLSVFYPTPQFLGQTKEKLSNPELIRLVDNAMKDAFDLYLTSDPKAANAILDFVLMLSDARIKTKKVKEISRKSPTKRIRLPGKLADCSAKNRDNTELFLVEGDSAGGTAKQARNRELQAILPLRGKTLNTIASSFEKFEKNKELNDLLEALGCGFGKNYDAEKLRYDKVIIMTDADVDGSHIACLLMSFFYQFVPDLIRDGHLFLSCPPLYKVVAGNDNYYVATDAELDDLMNGKLKNKKTETSRFKGLGEMMASQLKETTMDPKNRRLIQVCLPEENTEEGKEDSLKTKTLVFELMGSKPKFRSMFITEHAKFVKDIFI